MSEASDEHPPDCECMPSAARRKENRPVILADFKHHAPIYLGQTIQDRYHVFRKIGGGSQSRVWLAADCQQGGYVAIKAYRYDEKLIDCPVRSPHLESPTEWFVFEHAGKCYPCALVEPLGRTLEAVLESRGEIVYERLEAKHPGAWVRAVRARIAAQRGSVYYSESDDTDDEDDEHSAGEQTTEEQSDEDAPPELEPVHIDMEVYKPHTWSLKLTREICHQILKGLDALHSQGIAHRDLHPGNIALALDYDLGALTKEQIQSYEAWVWGDIAASVTDDWDRKNILNTTYFAPNGDNQDEPEVGKYMLDRGSSPLHDQLVLDECPSNLRVVIIDLGLSMPFEDCDQKLWGYREYQSPEAILPLTKTYKADIFSLGLVVWHIVIGAKMIEVMSSFDKSYDRLYFEDLERKIGPAPDHFRALFPEYPQGYHAWTDRPDFDVGVGDMRFRVNYDRPGGMTDEDTEVFLDLMKQMLQWEADKRPTTKELLAHPFFKESYISATSTTLPVRPADDKTAEE